MSQPCYSSVRCPKCDNLFLTVTGGSISGDRFGLVYGKAWRTGKRECPYCKTILIFEEWGKNIVKGYGDIDPDAPGNDYLYYVLGLRDKPEEEPEWTKYRTGKLIWEEEDKEGLKSP